MKQGEIWFANLKPTRGREQSGLRPVVVISGNAMNDHLDICIVCPLTTSIKNYPGSVVLKRNKANGLRHDSEVLAFQVRTLSKERLTRRTGAITSGQLAEIKSGLMDVLTY
jgi:mRNA interferase MazF